MGSETEFMIDRFRVIASEAQNPTTRRNLEQAVDVLQRFIAESSVNAAALDEDVVSRFVAWMFGRSYSYGTITQYIKSLSSLHGKAVKAASAGDCGCFAAVKARLKKASHQAIEIYSDRDCFKKLINLVRTDCSKIAGRQLAKDLVLFAVFNGGMSFERLASYKKNDYSGSDQSIIDIVGRYAKPRNKYLFPLRQSELTPAQLYRLISGLYADGLKMVGINLSSYDSSTSADLWASVAMSCGVAAADVRGCVGDMIPDNPLFAFAPCNDLTDDRRAAIRRYVADSLTKDPRNWYAMQFRPHVRYETIKSRMKERGLHFDDMFYPMEEIVRRVGKKMISESRPVVPGLLLFKSKAGDLPELFHHIGDLAWGYRQAKSAGSPYAVISPGAVMVYQHAIGSFTKDMAVYPAGTVELKEGDRVVIIGGDFVGYKAEFRQQLASDGADCAATKRVIYRLRLIGDNDIEWVVNLDSRLVSKLPDHAPDQAIIC